MNRGLAALGIQRAIIRYQIKESFLILSATVILPILIHTIPQYGPLPWGARLLPLYYAPFVAIVFFKPHVGILASLFGPLLSSLLTGLPNFYNVSLLTMNLTSFTIIAYLISRRFMKFYFVAPLSFALANISTLNLVNSALGLIILTLLNIFLIRLNNESS